MRRSTQLSFRDARLNKGRGGPRTGAGRPRVYKQRVTHHVRRPAIASRYPCHVQMRVRRGIPSLRSRRFMRAFRQTLFALHERSDFRVVHYSVQTNHVHLIVEAASKDALGRGMKALGSRFAWAVKRVFRANGCVMLGRYGLQILKTPRQVRNAIAYVLLNVRKHRAERGRKTPARLDFCSSGNAFDGWSRPPPGCTDTPMDVVAEPHTWLLSTGWRCWRLIDPAEVPGRKR